MYPNCRYVHDLEKYLVSKAEDLGSTCAIYTTKGFCPRGVTCRFAKSHLDKSGNNLKSDSYDANAPSTTFNGISTGMIGKVVAFEF